MVTETVEGSENTSWELEGAYEKITAEEISEKVLQLMFA